MGSGISWRIVRMRPASSTRDAEATDDQAVDGVVFSRDANAVWLATALVMHARRVMVRAAVLGGV
jgi:hypothetical protein